MVVKGQKVDTLRHKFGTVIGDNSSIGIQVSIMPGKTIGANTFIGSHAIISENIPSNTIYYAKQSKFLKEK